MNEDWREDEVTELGILKSVIQTLESQGRTLDVIERFMATVTRIHLGLIIACALQWIAIILIAVGAAS